MVITGLTATDGPTTMVLTYNRIPGIRGGRHRKGRAVAYSDMNLGGLIGNVVTLDEGVRASNKPSDAIVRDLISIEIAYVYVGTAYVDSATLIQWLRGLGKEVVMVACDCHKKEKQELATQLGIEILWASCGGGVTLMKLFDNTFFTA